MGKDSERSPRPRLKRNGRLEQRGKGEGKGQRHEESPRPRLKGNGRDTTTWLVGCRPRVCKSRTGSMSVVKCGVELPKFSPDSSPTIGEKRSIPARPTAQSSPGAYATRPPLQFLRACSSPSRPAVSRPELGKEEATSPLEQVLLQVMKKAGKWGGEMTEGGRDGRWQRRR